LEREVKLKARDWIPNQHGAWAMLITPLALLGFQFNWSINLVLLMFGWLFAYASSFFIGQTLKGWRNPDRRGRYISQIVLYSAIAILLVIPAVLVKPNLFWFAPIALVGFWLNLFFIKRRDERNWFNDIAGIFVSFALAVLYLNPSSIASAEFLIWPLLYFLGTVFYVKTMLRERGEQLWFGLSVTYHATITLLAAWFAPLVLFGYLIALVRAVVLPSRALKPVAIGLIEIGLTIAISFLALLC
jgi:hypothetical protein